MQSECDIVADPVEVDRRLVTLGLTRSRLVSAMLSGDAGSSSSTALHPPGNQGYRRWADTVAELRMQYLPHDWLYSNALNYCTIYNPRTRVAVVVMAGDVNTGSRLGPPRSRYPKGVATTRRLRINNRQRSLFPDLRTPAEVVEQDCVTWVLVQKSDEIGIHAELSRPRAQDASGHVADWYERILLPITDPRGHLSAGETRRPDDDIDFAVNAR